MSINPALIASQMGQQQNIPMAAQGQQPLAKALSSAAKNQSIFRLPFMIIAIIIATILLIISILMMSFMDNKIPGVVMFFISLLIAGAGIAFYIVPGLINKEDQGSISGFIQGVV
jgi:flagellar biosynthesis protein FliP